MLILTNIFYIPRDLCLMLKTEWVIEHNADKNSYTQTDLNVTKMMMCPHI